MKEAKNETTRISGYRDHPVFDGGRPVDPLYRWPSGDGRGAGNPIVAQRPCRRFPGGAGCLAASGKKKFLNAIQTC